MAYLTRLEDALTGNILYTFDKHPKVTTVDRSFKRNSGSYAVLGMDYGVPIFTPFAPPLAIRPFQWTFRIVVPASTNATTVNNALDVAGANFRRAVARGREHRLVLSDAGNELVVSAPVIDMQDVTKSSDNWRHRDFVVTWELHTAWQDRVSRGPHRIGDGSLPILGATPLVMGAAATPITGTSQTINVVADGSDGLPSTTVDDHEIILTVTGPFGGSGGFTIANGASLLKDDSGAFVATYLTYSQALLTGQTLTLDCAGHIATVNGVDVWASLVIPDYQPWWMEIVAGVINPIQIYGVGTGLTFGATTTLATAWYGKYM